MPAHTLPLDDIPASPAPIIISESTTHVVIATEISKALLRGYRRLFEQLIAAGEERSEHWRLIDIKDNTDFHSDIVINIKKCIGWRFARLLSPDPLSRAVAWRLP
jgi:hypothetical protein